MKQKHVTQRSQNSEKRISVICAPPIPENTGMKIVDFAAQNIFNSFSQVSLFTILTPKIRHYEHFPVLYHDAEENFSDIVSSDFIIFWGDFSHTWWHSYQALPNRLFSEGRYPTRKCAQNSIDKIFFLAHNQRDLLRRVIIFGESLLLKKWIDSQAERHFMLASRMFQNCHAAFLRDPISFARARTLADQNALACNLGVDAALLFCEKFMRDAHYDCNDNVPKIDGMMGLFFGRSKMPKFVLADFAKAVANASGAHVQWLPWLNDPKKSTKNYLPFFLGRKCNFSLKNCDLIKMIDCLRKCDFVLTDTYHLAVVSWGLGIPAICVGLGAFSATSTIDDKKKEIFFTSYSAEDFYVFGEMLQNWRSRRRIARDLVSHLSVEKNANEVSAAIQSDVRRARSCFALMLQ